MFTVSEKKKEKKSELHMHSFILFKRFNPIHDRISLILASRKVATSRSAFVAFRTLSFNF